MVLKNHAGDLDSFDRRLPRRHSLSRGAFANQLPANPAGKIQLSGSDFRIALVERSPDLSGTALPDYAFMRIQPHFLSTNRNVERRVASLCRRIQKEDQCQEN
jgi:hypothetical protein